MCLMPKGKEKKQQLKVRLRSYLVGYSEAVPNIIYIYVRWGVGGGVGGSERCQSYLNLCPNVNVSM